MVANTPGKEHSILGMPVIISLEGSTTHGGEVPSL